MVENEIRRGAFYIRSRKPALPQAGTGGYGIRPYVFERSASDANHRIYYLLFFIYYLCTG